MASYVFIYTIKSIKSDRRLLVYTAYNTSSKENLKLYQMYLVNKESLLSVPYGKCHVQTGATPCQTVTSLCLMLTSQHA